MPTYAYDKDKEKLRKVAKYDTSLMLSLKDVIPPEATKFLLKTKDAPEKPLRELYHTQNNQSLVRKIFTTCLKAILHEVAMGRCQFVWPNPGPSHPTIYVGELSESATKSLSRRGKKGSYGKIDLKKTGYKIPYIKYKFSNKSTRQHLCIYVNKNIYEDLVEHANEGGSFSKLPKDIDYFLPVIYEEFSYIKDTELKKLVNFCFRKVNKALRNGEEIRIIDGDGEIRFFRPLGKIHDKVMRSVVRKRLAKERKERYASIS